jgi:hypothetical protein
MINLLSYGIDALDLLKLKLVIDILLSGQHGDISDQDKILRVTNELSTYSNFRTAIIIMLNL